MRPGRVALLVATAAQTVGLGTVVALLADLQDAYGLPTWGLGLIGGVAFATSFVAYVWLARFADRGQARVMLVAGLAVSVVALVWTSLARDLWSLVVARAFFGLAEGVFVPAARRVFLDWSPGKPGEELGKLLAAGVLGFAVGPVLGGILADAFGLAVPFLVPAVVLLVLFPLILRLQPRPTPTVAVPGLRSVMRIPAVWAGVLLGATEYLSVGAFDAVWARLLTDRGASTTVVGISFAAFVVPMATLASRWGRLADRLTPMRVGAWAAMASIPLIGFYGLMPTPLALMVLSFFHGAVSAGVHPGASSAVARATPPETLATGQGLFEASGFLAAALAALPAGWLYEEIGPRNQFLLVASVCAALLAAALLLHRSTLSPAAAAAGSS
jgi:MFS family permease